MNFHACINVCGTVLGLNVCIFPIKAFSCDYSINYTCVSGISTHSLYMYYGMNAPPYLQSLLSPSESRLAMYRVFHPSSIVA